MQTESAYVSVDGRPGSSFLLSQPLNPPDRVTASVFTSVASSAPLLTFNQTRSDTRCLWTVCFAARVRASARHSQSEWMQMCLLALSSLSSRWVWVTNSSSPRVSLKEDGEHDRFKLLLVFQCTQTVLSTDARVHVRWLFLPAVSSDWDSTDALPLRSRDTMPLEARDVDMDSWFSPRSLSQTLFGIIAAYLHGPFAKSPPWQTERSPDCIFMPKIWFTLTYFHILFGCSISFTS